MYWLDWSSDVCSSDLAGVLGVDARQQVAVGVAGHRIGQPGGVRLGADEDEDRLDGDVGRAAVGVAEVPPIDVADRKSVVEGKGGGLGGRRNIQKKIRA